MTEISCGLPASAEIVTFIRCEVTSDTSTSTALWLDSTFWTMLTALASVALVLGACFAWKTARETLKQMKDDSADQARPYVYGVLEPGLWGPGHWDLRIRNAGNTAARQLTAEVGGWPETDDHLTRGLRKMFSEPQIIPPGVSYRLLWTTTAPANSEGPLPRPINGIPGRAAITFRYRGEDPDGSFFEDKYILDGSVAGDIMPAPASGPDLPPGMNPADRNRNAILKQIAVAVGELSR